MTTKFTGSPYFRSDGEEYVPEGSPSLKYMNAGPEIDEAWDELTKGTVEPFQFSPWPFNSQEV